MTETIPFPLKLLTRLIGVPNQQPHCFDNAFPIFDRAFGLRSLVLCRSCRLWYLSGRLLWCGYGLLQCRWLYLGSHSGRNGTSLHRCLQHCFRRVSGCLCGNATSTNAMRLISGVSGSDSRFQFSWLTLQISPENTGRPVATNCIYVSRMLSSSVLRIPSGLWP